MLKLTDRPWWKSSNVTKFDKIMPKLQNLRCLWQFLRAHLVLGKKIEPTFENVYAVGQIFIDVNGTILKK